MEVKLNKYDQALVKMIAKHRAEINDTEDVYDDIVVGEDRRDFAELNGYGGEVAFCRAVGIQPETHIVAGGGDEKWDAILRDGRTVDVKTTDHPRGNLLARRIHEDVDLFVLVRGKFPKYELVGYTDRETFQSYPPKNLGHGPTNFLYASRLADIEDLLP